MLETDQGVKMVLDSMGYWTTEAFLLLFDEFVTDVMIRTISVPQTGILDTHSVCVKRHQMPDSQSRAIR